MSDDDEQKTEPIIEPVSSSSKRKKSILRFTPSNYELNEKRNEERRATITSEQDSSQRRKSSAGDTLLTGVYGVASPSFLDGKKASRHSSSGSRNNIRTSKESIFSTFNSAHSSLAWRSQAELRPGQKVRFLDRLSWRSISALKLENESYSDDGKENLQQHFVDMQDDPNYLPGFVDLYYSESITITEETCCFRLHTMYKISDDNRSKIIYGARKEVDVPFSALIKFCCLQKVDIMRIGFTVFILNTSANNTNLLKFTRRTHWFANQLDIVETYHSLQDAHVGRIEKTSDGFRLIDRRGIETYKIFRESNQVKKFFTTDGTLIVFSCDTRNVVGKISYRKRKFIGRLCSMFVGSLKHKIRWSLEIGIAMKTLLLGVLFLELHSVEEYVDLPLGIDARTAVHSKLRRHSLF